MQKMLAVADINIDPITQVRVQHCQETIQDYADSLKAHISLPNIDVFLIDKQYWIADGFHRLKASSLAGEKYIPCEIHTGTRQDLLKFALGANHKHGLKRTMADKRNSVMVAYREFPEMSNRAIAEMCKVSHVLVNSISRFEVEELPVAEVVDNQGGNVKRPVKNESKLPTTQPEVRIGRDGKKRTVPTAPPENRDKVGQLIPDKILSFWERREEIQETLTTLSKVNGLLARVEKEKDELYAQLDFSGIKMHLSNAWSSIKNALPYAVCPTCHGKLKDTCVLCKGTGFISEFKWSTCVPQEQKDLISKLKK